jgi:hypothetical protein
MKVAHERLQHRAAQPDRGLGLQAAEKHFTAVTTLKVAIVLAPFILPEAAVTVHSMHGPVKP